MSGAVIVITEDGLITAHGIDEQNALLLAQHLLNLHRDLTTQMQARLEQMQAETGPQPQWIPRTMPVEPD